MIRTTLVIALLLGACSDDDAGTDASLDMLSETGTPDGDTPDGDTPDGDTPDGDTPDGDTPDADTPDGDTPDGDTPDADTPDGDTPDMSAVACAPLEPTESPANLVLTQIHIGESIQFFNPTADPINLAELGWSLCNRPAYPTLGDVGGGVTIGPGEYGMVDWASSFPPRDGSGEVGLYTGGPFGTPGNMRSYVCWSDSGTVTGSNRTSTAERAELWSGDCVPIPASGILRRRVGTDGASASAWEAADAVCE